MYTCILLTLVAQVVAKFTVSPIIIESNDGVCPSVDERESAIQQILRYNVHSQLRKIAQCGDGLWNQMAELDMKDSSQNCPPEWQQYNFSGIRTCGRPRSNTSSCTPKAYIPSFQYSRVCGRVIGYQFGSPDGFSCPHKELTNVYLDGVSITYGSQYQTKHIWSYVAGVSEDGYQLPLHAVDNCPCSPKNGSAWTTIFYRR